MPFGSSEIRSSLLITSRYKGWIGRVCEARENPVQNWLKQSEERYLWRGERNIYEGLEGVKTLQFADFQMPTFDWFFSMIDLMGRCLVTLLYDLTKV